VRTDEWKYIRYPHGDGKPDRHVAEMYNLKSDPDERNNLINEPRYAGKLKELQAELLGTMAASGLPAEKDAMPLDQGIGKALPDAKIR
jgi:N-acetylglucosamine-6-sulfatase